MPSSSLLLATSMLTSKALDSVSVDERKREQHIQEFIQSQQRYACDYARDGKKYFSSLAFTREGSNSGSSPMAQLEHDETRLLDLKATNSSANAIPRGFSSPVLKPRAPKGKKRAKQGDAISFKPHTKSDDHGSNSSSSSRTDESNQLVSHHSKHDGKDEIDEQVLRLNERRKRKSQRREILKPRLETTDRKRKKGFKSTVPAGLSLLHGFTAENIGKNRLTLLTTGPKPSGILNRGKASKKTKVTTKKDNRKGLRRFSEAEFLANSADQTKSVGLARSRSKSVISVSSRSISSEKTSPKKYRISNGMSKRRRAEKMMPLASRGAPAAKSTSSKSRSPSIIRSEVWDIESKHSNKGKIKEVTDRQSLLIDIAPKRWDESSEKKAKDRQVSLKWRQQLDGHASSLCPSQSASQHNVGTEEVSYNAISKDSKGIAPLEPSTLQNYDKASLEINDREYLQRGASQTAMRMHEMHHVDDECLTPQEFDWFGGSADGEDCIIMPNLEWLEEPAFSPTLDNTTAWCPTVSMEQTHTIYDGYDLDAENSTSVDAGIEGYYETQDSLIPHEGDFCCLDLQYDTQVIDSQLEDQLLPDDTLHSDYYVDSSHHYNLIDDTDHSFNLQIPLFEDHVDYHTELQSSGLRGDTGDSLAADCFYETSVPECYFLEPEAAYCTTSYPWH